jgi:hypothetical protein
MITPEEWSSIAGRVFRPRKPQAAPPFLVTRILAKIEAIETSQRYTWWRQLVWMSQMSAALGLAALVLTGYFWTQAPPPVEAWLKGYCPNHQAIQVATTQFTDPGRTTDYILQEEPWVDD